MLVIQNLANHKNIKWCLLLLLSFKCTVIKEWLWRPSEETVENSQYRIGTGDKIDYIATWVQAQAHCTASWANASW